MASKITKLTREEADRLSASGVLTIKSPPKVPAPPAPVVSDSDMQAAHEMMEAAKGVAAMANETTVRQSQLIENMMAEIAKLQSKPETAGWKKLRVHFERDRNNMLRSAEFEKVE